MAENFLNEIRTLMMKKIFKMISAALLLVFVFTGCSAKSRGGEEQDNTLADGIYLQKLEVYSNVVNAEQIYHISYPYYYYAFTTDTDGNIGSHLFDLTDPISPKDLTEQENRSEYFIEYIKSLPETEKGENLACYVICRYIDVEGNEENIYRRCYDDFPKDWEVFIDWCNQICGGEYLSGQGQLQAVTPEFLTDVFGITDDDVREGTLQDMIDLLELDMKEVTAVFRIKEALNEYYAVVKEPLIEPHRPKELVFTDSTQEEYEAFLTQFFEKIGADNVTEVESEQEYFRRFYLADQGKYFYTARTSEIEKLPVRKRSTDGYYYMELDAHMEGMVMGTDFIYSADEKYILVPMENDPDVMIAFCE